MKLRIYPFLIVIVIAYSGIAGGNEAPDGDKSLLASCQALSANSEQETGQSCIYFIQGFIAAAQAIDPPIIKKQSEKRLSKWWSSFMERVYRTRGSKREVQTPPNRIIPFCVPHDESKARVIEKVSKQLSSPIDTREMLSGRIYAVLKTEYPCEKPLVKANEESNGG